MEWVWYLITTLLDRQNPGYLKNWNFCGRKAGMIRYSNRRSFLYLQDRERKKKKAATVC